MQPQENARSGQIMSRRTFLKQLAAFAGTSAGAALLAACGATGTSSAKGATLEAGWRHVAEPSARPSIEAASRDPTQVMSARAYCRRRCRTELPANNFRTK